MQLGGTTGGDENEGGTEVAGTWVDQAACPPRPHPLAPSPERERGKAISAKLEQGLKTPTEDL
jgi:hypothetical protein